VNFWDFFNLHFICLFIFFIAFFLVLFILLFIILLRSKITVTKEGSWTFNISPLNKEYFQFIKDFINNYQMDCFKRSFFEESKERKIKICQNAIKEITESLKTVKTQAEKDKLRKDKHFWENQLLECESSRWHGEYCEDSDKYINNIIKGNEDTKSLSSSSL